MSWNRHRSSSESFDNDQDAVSSAVDENRLAALSALASFSAQQQRTASTGSSSGSAVAAPGYDRYPPQPPPHAHHHLYAAAGAYQHYPPPSMQEIDFARRMATARSIPPPGAYHQEPPHLHRRESSGHAAPAPPHYWAGIPPPHHHHLPPPQHHAALPPQSQQQPQQQESEDQEEEEEQQPPQYYHHNNLAMLPQGQLQHHHAAAAEPAVVPEEDEEDDDEDEVVQAAPRGKPEAMAAKLAAAQIEAKRQELAEEERERAEEAAHAAAAAAAKSQAAALAAAAIEKQRQQQAQTKKKKSVSPKKKSAGSPARSSSSSGGASPSGEPPAKKARPTSPKPPGGGKRSTSPTPGGKKKAAKKSEGGAKATKKKSAPAAAGDAEEHERTELLLNERAPPITHEEYESLEGLMVQFCKVPLLAEFSRPVSLLHPELVASYSKIVTHPVDLGHVCRGIRKRQYNNTRDIRLDMWRVFANCVKFHSHPQNKDAVPSFVSIALHLREYFNNLWQEYMLPSDQPEHVTGVVKLAFAKRARDRAERMANAGVLVLSNVFIRKTSELVDKFVESGGRVDLLDRDPIFGEQDILMNRELLIVVENLKKMSARLMQVANQPAEYTIDQFYTELKACYTGDVLEEDQATRNRVANRVDRLFWKRAIPLHEANSRGVTQSSIWGNVAAAIWARESSKKPYWPALCLGILPPEDQREGWHQAVTDRNESRLPAKLRTQLMTAKWKCEQAQRRQNLSYFLVEFLGTHEFIWVRETDILEKFDPEDDPNKNAGPGAAASNKKKRPGRGGPSQVVGSKTYQTALEECTWAVEEYETVLQDAFDEESDQEDVDEDEEMNYSYSLLAQSDDEADAQDDHGFMYDETNMSDSDAEEANYLLANDGRIVAGAAPKKKPTKSKRAQAAATKKKKAEAAAVAAAAAAAEKTRKEAAEKEKQAAAKKAKAELQKQKTKEREEKKELKEIEKRRKKRTRDRDKAIKDEARKLQKRRKPGGTAAGASSDPDDDERGLARNKKARAAAIVKAYVNRMANQNSEYKSLALSGVMTIPAAMVDSTGLLGMALAFRAAAGEISMPDDLGSDSHHHHGGGKGGLSHTSGIMSPSGSQHSSFQHQPWLAIDTTKPKSSAHRVRNLKRKIELMEVEIKRIESDTRKRQELTKRAVAERMAMDMEIQADDAAARRNHFKKKKKPASSPSPSGGAGGGKPAAQSSPKAAPKPSPTSKPNNGSTGKTTINNSKSKSLAELADTKGRIQHQQQPEWTTLLPSQHPHDDEEENDDEIDEENDPYQQHQAEMPMA